MNNSLSLFQKNWHVVAGIKGNNKLEALQLKQQHQK